MENKINIAEILKDCPKGMELDCALFENLEFDRIDKDNKSYPIICRVKTEWGSYNVHTFTKYGCYSTERYSKCIIFPKGKTTWEGFQRPFKDGDILFAKSAYSWIFIYKESENKEDLYNYAGIANHPNHSYIVYEDCPLCCKKDVTKIRFATEEEKQKLFDAIKANGYKWNAETKTLEKLPKFKVGDRVKHISDHTSGIVVKVGDEGYYINYYYISYPKGNGVRYISFTLEKDYELLPNKFDITTLVPFESKVLVRDEDHHEWEGAIFGRYDGKKFFTIGGMDWGCCIPYEGNEHLLGKNIDCEDFYKNW